jgi:enoyl-CoA hydratase
MSEAPEHPMMIDESSKIAEWETLTIGVEGPVATITLSRPNLLNRFDQALHTEFIAALREVRDRSGVRAVVLASSGKVFSAGGDFDWIRSLHDDTGSRTKCLDEGRLLITSLLDFPLPIVAALQGDAFGLGATVIAGCDAVVASRTVGLADSHVLIGLVAGDGGCVVWPQAIGMLRAKRYLLSGDRLPAEEAHAIGLVTDLVDEPDQALPAARALADRLAALPPLAVQGTKRALNRVLLQRAGEVVDLSFAHESISIASDDMLEAIDAFQQRRPATYRGR